MATGRRPHLNSTTVGSTLTPRRAITCAAGRQRQDEHRRLTAQFWQRPARSKSAGRRPAGAVPGPVNAAQAHHHPTTQPATLNPHPRIPPPCSPLIKQQEASPATHRPVGLCVDLLESHVRLHRWRQLLMQRRAGWEEGLGLGAGRALEDCAEAARASRLHAAYALAKGTAVPGEMHAGACAQCRHRTRQESGDAGVALSHLHRDAQLVTGAAPACMEGHQQRGGGVADHLVKVLDRELRPACTQPGKQGSSTGLKS